MKKFISMLCILSICCSSIVALANTDEEITYSAEGGYFKKDYKNYHTTYTDPEGNARYIHFGTIESMGGIYLKLRTVYSPDIVVPETIDGIPVVKVCGREAKTSIYESSKKLESIVFPDSCKEIVEFQGYVNLKEVSLPENLEILSEKVFKNCTSLKSVKLHENIKAIKSQAFGYTAISEIDLSPVLENIGEGAFSHTENLKEVTIPSSVQNIGKQAFSKSGIKKVNFQNEDVILGEMAFYGCPNLEEVTGLSKEKIIENWKAFDYTPWQKNMKNDEEPYLIDKNGKLVAYVGSDTDIVIPDGVKTIVKDAFISSDITSIIIPDSVEKIEERAFYGCKNLEKLTIPGSVTQIGLMAFSNCFNLKEIIFEYGEKVLNLTKFAFQGSAVTQETVHKNNRSISNFDAAFKNTALDPDEAPIETEVPTQTPTTTEQPSEIPTVKPTEKPTQTPTAKPTEEPSQTPVPTPLPQPQEKEVIKVVSANNALSIFADEKEIEFTDAKPFIDENGRTQIPIRAVGEALGCEVLWEETERMVRLKKENFVVTITIDSNKMTVGEKEIEMDTTAKIIGGRTYIPLRFAGEALGFEVEWIVK